MNKVKLYGLIIVIFTTLLSLIPSLTYAANSVISGSGTKDDPYSIDMGQIAPQQVTVDGYTINSAKVATIEITNAKLKEMAKEKKEDKKGFWFEFVNDDGGTFYVIYKKEEDNVTFIKINDEKAVISGDANYVQAGAVPKGTTAEDTFIDAPFIIKAEESFVTSHNEVGFSSTHTNQKDFDSRDVSRSLQLKNAPKPYAIGGQGLDVPDPACFVFAKKQGTAKSFYEEHSKQKYGSNDYIYYSKDPDRRGIADWFTNKGYIAALKLYADGMGTGISNYTVRFATYDGNNKDIMHCFDDYKVNVKYQFRLENVPTPVKEAGVIETAITWILIAVGEVFMFVIKIFLGNNVTIDAIIFNRYDPVIIDLRGGAGPFAEQAVKEIINPMYTGFQFLAIIINIVVLLYIGVQIIMSAGTDKQSKYTKNLQNWVVGVLILFMAPQFFPFLTDITNGIVSYIGKDTQPMYTQYNIIALLDDEELLGENAQTADLDKYVTDVVAGRKKDIEALQKEIEGMQNRNNDIANQLVQAAIQGIYAAIGYNNSMEETIRNYVDDNINNWTMLNEEAFKDLIEQHRANNRGLLAKGIAEKNIEQLTKYKTNSVEIKRLEEEIKILEDYAATGGKSDLMSTMRTNAGKTGRVIYAIIWLILIFQMITLLAMYYKRIIMVAILIMIFPIVMITYAIDKIGDGAAQTLENWTKEFTINILVQIVHAIIYVTLIQSGLDIYAANQDNWLFLLVAVLFLFPGERLLRSIFGMNGSTIGSLKANIGGAIAMGATAYGAGKGLAKGAVKGAKAGAKGVKGLAGDIKNKGVKGTAKDMWKGTQKAIKDGWKNLGKDDAKDAQDKKRQAVADRKKRARDTNMERRREQMKTAGAAKKAMLGAVNVASQVRNGMYEIGNAGRKVKRGIHGMKKNAVGKTFKLAGKGINGGIKGMRKVAGATMGISSGITGGLAAAGSKGISSGIAQGIHQGKAVKDLVGGPSPKQKQEKKEPKDRSMNGNNPIVKTGKHMPGGQKYKRANTASSAGKQREGVRGVGKTSRKIKGTRKVNKAINKKTQVKESNS